MKRLCLILAFLFLFAQTSSALLLPTPKVVYRGTITGLRISAVDGTAFIDNAGATIPTYADGNHQIEIYDDSNRMLRGVLKAAGTGETLGDEVFSSWANSGTAPFETFTSSGLDISEATETGTTGRALGNTTTIELGLYKFGFTTSLLSGTFSANHTFVFSAAATGNYSNQARQTITLASGAQSGYGTILTSANYVAWRTVSAISFAIADFTFKQVTAPSSSGCTIVSAKGGDTYNWAYKNSSFVFNASSYYCIIKSLR